MTEKKGFFRRVFSFGQPEETAIPQETSAPTPALGAPATEDARGERDGDAAGLPSTDADALAETPVAIEPAPLSEPAASVAADEPVWLDPEAPEPEADFSWLDADASEKEPTSEGEPDVEAPVSDDGPTDLATTDETQEIPADAIDAPGAVRTSDDDALSAASPTLSPQDFPKPAFVEEDDFSFLDADAPLPDEEEDDFSWLASDAPLPKPYAEEAPSPSGSVAAIGAAGIAAAGVSASPSTGEGGWRLREAAVPVQAPAAPRTTFIDRLREGLSRSSSQLSGSITALFTKRRLDEETLQDFEDVLLQADLGVETALRITDRLSEGRFGKEITGDQVKTILADEVEATLRPVALPLELDLEKKPHVILVVGVNGTGKTTTIGKLAAKLTRGGLKVTLCAGDTFRAAAVEQLKIWGERTGSEVVAKAIGADAAGLAYEAYDRAVENDSDVLIIDTAGRLQNKAELMAELEKIVRVLQKREPDAPHTVLQTLDATTGQNALSQVEIFRNVAGVNGLVMTKLDGTARGGILVAIAAKYRLPVYFVGVGEGIDDLEPFKARDFAMAIAGKA